MKKMLLLLLVCSGLYAQDIVDKLTEVEMNEFSGLILLDAQIIFAGTTGRNDTENDEIAMKQLFAQLYSAWNSIYKSRIQANSNRYIDAVSLYRDLKVRLAVLYCVWGKDVISYEDVIRVLTIMLNARTGKPYGNPTVLINSLGFLRINPTTNKLEIVMNNNELKEFNERFRNIKDIWKLYK